MTYYFNKVKKINQKKRKKSKKIKRMTIKCRTRKSNDQEKTDLTMLFRKNNIIHLYCEIDRSVWMKFNEMLYEMNEDNSINEIILRISSGGGEVHYAFNIASLVENSKKPIHGIVDSECSSAALFILLACKTRKATRCSEFLIHEGSIEIDLKTTELIKQYNAELVLEKETKDYILAKTKIKSKQYDIINADGMAFYSYDAIKYGIISEVI
jgi:ATP-dependent protease ClpP protease subunit